MAVKDMFTEKRLELLQRAWKTFMWEFFGTFFYVLFVGNAHLGPPVIGIFGRGFEDRLKFQNAVVVALTATFVFASILYFLGLRHFNPAATVGFIIAGRGCPVTGLAITVPLQILGAILGTAVLCGLTDSDLHSAIGIALSPDYSEWQGFCVELLGTMLIVSTMLKGYVMGPGHGGGEIYSGLAVGASHLFGRKYTSAVFNPARAFGTAAIVNAWKSHWIYWIGPLIGGVLSGLFFRFFWQNEENPSEPHECLLMKPSVSVKHPPEMERPCI